MCVVQYVHWQLSSKVKLKQADQWYQHTPRGRGSGLGQLTTDK